MAGLMPQSTRTAAATVHPRVPDSESSSGAISPTHSAAGNHQAGSPVAAPAVCSRPSVAECSVTRVAHEAVDVPGAPEPAPPAAFAVEVEGVDGVGAGVVVVVAGAARDRVDLQEAAEGGVVEADAHEGEAGEGVGGPLLAAEPAVASGAAA